MLSIRESHLSNPVRIFQGVIRIRVAEMNWELRDGIEDLHVTFP